MHGVTCLARTAAAMVGTCVQEQLSDLSTARYMQGGDAQPTYTLNGKSARAIAMLGRSRVCVCSPSQQQLDHCHTVVLSSTHEWCLSKHAFLLDGRRCVAQHLGHISVAIGCRIMQSGHAVAIRRRHVRGGTHEQLNSSCIPKFSSSVEGREHGVARLEHVQQCDTVAIESDTVASRDHVQRRLVQTIFHVRICSEANEPFTDCQVPALCRGMERSGCIKIRIIDARARSDKCLDEIRTPSPRGLDEQDAEARG
eukprot:scaffold1139_cov62-Phaeocystis_antarctica.AAC.4